MSNLSFRDRKNIGRRLQKLLKKGDLPAIINFIDSSPPKALISPLIRFFYRPDALERWLAIRAFGRVMARLAEKDMEEARIVMRRLMWSLNDESGGIGWGAPEAMAEAMANHKGLSREYARILLSYVWEEGNFLEYLPLRRGALWGLYRLSKSQKEIYNEINANKIVSTYLDDNDPTSKVLATLAIGYSGDKTFCQKIQKGLSDKREVELFIEDEVKKISVSEASKIALDLLGC